MFSHQKKSFLFTTVMDGNMAAIYTLIYTFLVQKSLTKTAQALKKEVKGVVVLKDGVKPEGPSLVDILHEWRMQQSKQASDDSMCSLLMGYPVSHVA